MTRNWTCIICPNGCQLLTESSGGKLLSVTGNLCPKGGAWVRQELLEPCRTLSTSAAVRGGTLPLVSVRLTHPVPKKHIPAIMQRIRELRLTAPVAAGEVVLPAVLGLDNDVIATRTVGRV